MKHGLDIVWLVFCLFVFSFLLHVTQFQMSHELSNFRRFLIIFLILLPDGLFYVHFLKVMDLIVITKTCYSGFLFTFLEFWETLRGLSPWVWAFSLLVFTVTSSKLITYACYAIIMHTRHKNQNRPIVKVHESHNARSRDIPSHICHFCVVLFH